MKYKPIVIVAGEPNSILIEIFLKIVKKKKFKSPLILICSKKIFVKQLKFFKEKIKFNEINKKEILLKNIKLKKLNLVDIEYDQADVFEHITSKSNKYIENSFNIGLEIIKSGLTNKFINGPVSKKNFLKKKFAGITEYLAHKTNTTNFAMIIFNRKLSVCPITTHEPLKLVSKKINKKNIVKKIKIINNFWNSKFKFKPKIAVTGLNPHCESTDQFNEDKRIIIPAIKVFLILKIIFPK